MYRIQLLNFNYFYCTHLPSAARGVAIAIVRCNKSVIRQHCALGNHVVAHKIGEAGDLGWWGRTDEWGGMLKLRFGQSERGRVGALARGRVVIGLWDRLRIGLGARSQMRTVFLRLK